MAIINSFDTAKYAAGNGIADKVYAGVDAILGGAGDLGSSIQSRRAASGKPVNGRAASAFANMGSMGGGGQGGLASLFKGSASAGGASAAGGSGMGGKAGGMGSGMATGAIGAAIDKAWTLTNGLIGDSYTRGRSAFDSDIINTAYGRSNDDPFFGGIGRERNAKRLANDIRNESFYATSRNMGDLQQELANPDLYHNEVDGVTDGQRTAGVLQGVGTGAAKGAKYGSIAGPMGMAIGAVAGAVGGAVTKLFGHQRAKRRLRRINAAIRYNNMQKAAQVADSVSNLTTMEGNKALANMAAAGGWQRVLGACRLASAHRYADGGDMLSAGEGKVRQSHDDWPGITEINAGGSHEENRRGGVPQGVAPDGAPNLVEEGEVKLSDILGGGNQYILSARIVITPEMASEYGIDKKHVGKTYAQGFKDAYSQYKDRLGHPEVRNEVARLCSAFQQAQDAEKELRATRQTAAVMESLPPEQREAVMDAATAAASQGAQAARQDSQAQAAMAVPQGDAPVMDAGQEAMPQDAALTGEVPYTAYGGRVRSYALGGVVGVVNKYAHKKPHSYAKGGILAGLSAPIVRPGDAWEKRRMAEWARLNGYDAPPADPDTPIRPYRPAPDVRPGGEDVRRMAEWAKSRGYGMSRPESADAEEAKTDADIARSAHDRALGEVGADSLRRKASLDKAPVLAGLYAWLRTKDYLQNADRYNRIIREGLGRSMVSPERVGGYYSPKYLDPDFGNAALRSSTAQALRNAAALTGGNRAAAAASQAVIFSRAARARGERLNDARMANEELRARAWQMNRGLDQYNAQTALQADSQNAARVAAAYDKMEQTEASVDQYNKAMRLGLFQNAANLLGRYGVDARNRLTVAAMTANGLFSKGAGQVYNDMGY